jgi:membrane protease YdiL (CAAX protease family)
VLVSGASILWQNQTGHAMPSDGTFIIQPVLHNPAALIGMMVVIVGIAPIMEEWLFRGALQPSLASVIPTPLAIGIVSLLFAGMHELDAVHPLAHPWLWVPLLPLALILGITRARTRTMSTNIGLHMGFNGWAVFLLIMQILR